MPNGDLQQVWNEIRQQIWPAIEELRRFRVKALLSLVGVVALVGVAWGVETSRVSSHMEQEGLHVTVAQATSNAERIQKIESKLGENCKKIDELTKAVNEQKEAQDTNTEKILDAINRRNGEEGGSQ